MLERIALTIVKWLLRFATEWMIVRADVWDDKTREAIEIRGEALSLLNMVEPLLEELEQTRNAYDALLEEMEELCDG